MDNDSLTGDPKKDFPELYDNAIDNFDESVAGVDVHHEERLKENNYLKKVIIEELIDFGEVGKDKTIYDKRLKRPLFKRILDVFFKE